MTRLLTANGLVLVKDGRPDEALGGKIARFRIMRISEIDSNDQLEQSDENYIPSATQEPFHS